jgi:hypothetical protein
MRPCNFSVGHFFIVIFLIHSLFNTNHPCCLSSYSSFALHFFLSLLRYTLVKLATEHWLMSAVTCKPLVSQDRDWRRSDIDMPKLISEGPAYSEKIKLDFYTSASYMIFLIWFTYSGLTEIWLHIVCISLGFQTFVICVVFKCGSLWLNIHADIKTVCKRI